MIEFTIHGPIKGGKNNYKINPRTGLHYPSKKWAEWRNSVVSDLAFFMLERGIKTITEPLRMDVRYWAGDNRRRDVTAMADAIFHCLERADLIEDDFQIKSLSWMFWGLDRKNPRAEITLTTL